MKKIFLFVLLSVYSFTIFAQYDFNKAFWNCWPVNSGKVKTVRNKTSRLVVFDFNKTTSPISLYTRGKGYSGKLCRLDLEFDCKNLQKQDSYSAKLKITFFDKKKKTIPGGLLTKNIQLFEGKNTVSTSFVVPKNTDSYMVSISVTKVAGSFIVSNCKIQALATNVKVAKIATFNKNTSWKNAVKINGFFQYGSINPAKSDSFLSLAYDHKNLYVKVVCQEDNMAKILAKVNKKDGPVYLDDSVELFLANKNRSWQFVVNTLNITCDGELKVRVPGDPRKLDSSWNGSWTSFITKEPKQWIAYFIIPFADIDFTPIENSFLRLNVLRNRRGASFEQTQLDRRFGMPGNEAHFSKIFFKKNEANFVRSIMEMDKDTLAILRDKKEFENVPKKDGKYLIIGPGCDIYLERYTKNFRDKNRATWEKRTMDAVAAMQKNNMLVPAFYPWVVPHLGGRKSYNNIMKKYPNLKFGLAVHNTSHDRAIIKKGTKYYHKNLSNVGDLNLVDCTAKFLENFLDNNKDNIKNIVFARGFDEPTNTLIPCFSYSLNPNNLKALKELDKEICQNYGFGKYGMPDLNRGMQDKDDGLRHIAFCRWWNNQAFITFSKLQKILKDKAPNLPFMPLVCNTVDAYSGFEELPLLSQTGNWIGVDPYPTSTRSVFSIARAIYHTGFATKLAKDLSGNSKVFVYIQAFKYHGQAPNQENLNEWVSQSLKNGADILSFYAYKNLEDCPNVYKWVLKASNQVTNMNKLDIPTNSPIAILYNYVGNWGRFDRGQMDYYSLHSIFAEKIKGNFAFISDRQIKQQVPKHIKVCFAPSLEYVDEDVAQSLENFVKKGGTLVTFDPLAFRVTSKGTPLTQRKTLLGNPTLTKLPEFKEIYFGSKRQALKLFDDNVIKSQAVKVPLDAKVKATWPNGSCAAYSRIVGKGKVVFFSINPFANANVALNTGNWQNYFERYFVENNVQTKMKIWDFVLPIK